MDTEKKYEEIFKAIIANPLSNENAKYAKSDQLILLKYVVFSFF